MTFFVDSFEAIVERNGDQYDYHTEAQILEELVETAEIASVLVHDIMVQKNCITFKVDGSFEGVIIWCAVDEVYYEFEGRYLNCPMVHSSKIEEVAARLIRELEEPYS